VCVVARTLQPQTWSLDHVEDSISTVPALNPPPPAVKDPSYLPSFLFILRRSFFRRDLRFPLAEPRSSLFFYEAPPPFSQAFAFPLTHAKGTDPFPTSCGKRGTRWTQPVDAAVALGIVIPIGYAGEVCNKRQHSAREKKREIKTVKE